MSNVSERKKEGILKSLAIIGLVFIIILIAWLSVRIVAVVPSAFSSLASLAEGISQFNDAVEESQVQPLVVTSDTKILNSGESVTINWIRSSAQGSYTFKHECTDGVTITVVGLDGVREVSCDTNYNIGNTDTLTLIMESENERYVDVQYEISFLKTEDTLPSFVGSSLLTIVNSTIPEDGFVVAEESETVLETVVETETEEVTVETSPEIAVVPTPTFEQEFIYTIPVSNPNGVIDITTRYLASGKIQNNRFVAGIIQKEEDGAIQFEVRNTGTKTSEDWTFSFELPNGGQYESPEQAPLKPNERAVLTVGFVANDDNFHRFDIEVKTDTDRNVTNNDFSQSVIFFN